MGAFPKPHEIDSCKWIFFCALCLSCGKHPSCLSMPKCFFFLLIYEFPLQTLFFATLVKPNPYTSATPLINIQIYALVGSQIVQDGPKTSVAAQFAASNRRWGFAAVEQIAIVCVFLGNRWEVRLRPRDCCVLLWIPNVTVEALLINVLNYPVDAL